MYKKVHKRPGRKKRRLEKSEDVRRYYSKFCVDQSREGEEPVLKLATIKNNRNRSQ